MTFVTPPFSGHSQPRKPFKPVHLSYVLPLLVLSASLFITFVLWNQAQQDALQKLQLQFDSDASAVNRHVMQRMLAYKQVLRGVNGFFAHANAVQRDEFHEYIDRLQLAENYPGIQGVGFVLIVPALEKDRHIAAIRKQGFPEYTIKPEGKRDTYTSSVYIEPFNESNQRALGHDMYSDPVLRTAMEMARDSGHAAMSGKVTLIQETGKHAQAGFLMYLPVYGFGLPHETIAERRANIIGWAYAPFRMGDLMNNILGEHSKDIDIEIYDGGDISGKTLMYDSDDTPGSRSGALLQTITSMELAGHTWTVEIRSQPALELLEKSKIITYNGIGISFLLALLTWLLVHGRAQAIKMAQAMNDDLIKKESELRSLFDNASEGIWVMDTDKRTVKANRALLEILGTSESELVNKSIYDFVDKKSFQGNASEPQEGGIGQNLEAEIKRPDGANICCQFNMSSIQDENGNTAGTFALVTDITGRKQNEEMLRGFYTAIEQSPVSVVITDTKGDIQYTNPKFTAVTGYTAAEALGQNPRILKSGQTPQETYQDLWKNISSGKIWHGELLNKRKSGKLYWEDVHIAPVADPAGSVTRYVCLKTDITERKESKAAIERLGLFYKLQGDMNSANIHATNQGSLFNAVCSIAAGSGLFRMAWIGLLDQQSGDILPVAQAGAVGNYIDNLKINISHNEKGRGPTASVIMTGQLVVCDDIANNPAMLPWRENALKHGYRASIALPLRQKGQVIGSLNLYLPEVGLLTNDVIQLLDSLAADISFTLSFLAESEERERMQREVQEMALFLETTREDERKHLARELHDELGQTMTALRFDLNWMEEQPVMQDSAVSARIMAMKNIVGETVDVIRHISENLRPGMLDDLGLTAAIENHTMNFAERTGIACNLVLGQPDFDLDEHISTALFRIVQESLTNIARHSGADHASIQLHELQDNMLLIVQDNGRGLPHIKNADRKTFGLTGMRERVKMLGGTLEVYTESTLGAFTESGAGVCIEVSIPKHITKRPVQ